MQRLICFWEFGLIMTERIVGISAALNWIGQEGQ
jgi:hypothetical protein